MTLSMEPEAAAAEVIRLRIELAHVSEQCQVAHGMAQDWRQRALAAEEQCRKLEKKYQNLRKRKGMHDEADDGEEGDAALSLPAVW